MLPYLFLLLQNALQHDVAEGEGVVQPYFVGLTDDALGQGFGIVGLSLIHI